jgi:STE24 endopeptidase
MPILLLCFIIASFATTAFTLALDTRQSSFVMRHRNTVPAAFAGQVSLAEHQLAADYENAGLRFNGVEANFQLCLGLAWATFGYDALFGRIADHLGAGLTRSVVFIVAAIGISSLLDLPFSVYRTFVIEQRFGFNRTTPLGFVVDKLKAAGLSLAFAVPLLYGLMALMRLGGLWWVWAWLGIMVVIIALMEVYPRWIAPLFNHFTPLEGPLRTRVEALLQRCGFAASGLFVMDASRRSAHGNAYFSGLGRSKQIVLFDTLIESNTEAELEAVLAHELGHFKLKHIVLGLVTTAVTLFFSLLAIGWLCRQPWLLPSFGISHQDDALALIVCVLVVQMASPLLSLISNWISRRHEYQADDFARQMVGAEPMISALVRLSRDNASTLTTDPLYALIHFSHPPVPQRVQRLAQA